MNIERRKFFAKYFSLKLIILHGKLLEHETGMLALGQYPYLKFGKFKIMLILLNTTV